MTADIVEMTKFKGVADPAPARPVALPVQAANIPESLKSRRQWLLWRYDLKGSGFAKVPYQVNGRRASSTDPKTWNHD